LSKILKLDSLGKYRILVTYSFEFGTESQNRTLMIFGEYRVLDSYSNEFGTEQRVNILL